MRVSIEYKFTFLCQPKCASTSIEKALDPYSQLSTSPHHKLKHKNFRQYERHIKPFINQKNMEVVCLMREPISWLNSWYRYRCRPRIKNSPNYCGNLTFQEWIEEYLLEERPSRSNIGVQNTFFSNSKGEIGVDKIFKYENLEEIIKFFESKVGKTIEIPQLNKSPEIDFHLKPETIEKLKEVLKDDYKIYESL